MIREYFKDFKATERAKVDAQRGSKKKKSLKRKGVDGGGMKEVLGKRNKSYNRRGEDFVVYTIDIREHSLIQEYGSKTESKKRKRNTGSSSVNKKKKSKMKKKKKNTRESKSEETEVEKRVKEMISGISKFVRNW